MTKDIDQKALEEHTSALFNDAVNVEPIPDNIFRMNLCCMGCGGVLWFTEFLWHEETQTFYVLDTTCFTCNSKNPAVKISSEFRQKIKEIADQQEEGQEATENKDDDKITIGQYL
ncbi:MAG: hypothetical protein A3F94_01030 [Candidatus Spechtbacteria bacterium RIFCSPLOWO2_12_FULL_38_22]|uniref:Uncharacterized protein n=1 Tax=Candidatus Spechtbacteria bacterium RIFCSPLOWO2_12_FULL_38_22 TaxID=1802165 RepID=A0A1G2HIQ5_9BACT|nr:MAG: hypothetical protein A2728_01570 [Candidatus Spechtbacteria bacterium RIFCSPHIGHO2_01_FULL_38_11]OGZ59856.1 MAG: hypothetical protein A3E58_02100 [Candidatus Spechtbacteria bacterium RIFCSPHIGHO2_12_FULL_38_30]OGZ60747.1 MAG: hypothetical protein A3A00_02455 [Candidatus Spechtbacteria bacterium RIFCSPLOWO2_01_FULL_38_20]OGZ62150.1 MAG: hypothetical protein A3F94_01030 [Candidatus Spechtbacteria bacterium RIFCSPLOWO2_12_FULL_38_22]